MQNRHSKSERKVHPALFLLLLCLIFFAPSIVVATSGGKIERPQLPNYTFPMMKR